MEIYSKHGTFRPNLAKLIASNTPEEVRTTTANAFAEYAQDEASYAKAITALSKLKGIGPATASLLLACYDPVRVPFFSDELYRYLHWSEAKGKGWDRKINYSMKEYKDLYEKTQALRERLEKESGDVVKTIDLEKMAYALGKAVQRKDDREFNEDNKEISKAAPSSPRRRRRKTSEEPNEMTPQVPSPKRRRK